MNFSVFLVLSLSAVGYSQRNPVYNAMNEFGIKLFQETAKDLKSVEVPVLNVVTSLTALLFGSTGTAADEIATVLGYKKHELSKKQILDDLKTLLTKVNYYKAGLVYENLIKVPSALKLLPGFSATLENLFVHVRPDDNLDNSVQLENQFNLASIWKYEFEYSDADAQIDDLMHVKGIFAYVSDIYLHSQLVEIPFDGDQLSMVIILPKKSINIQEFNKNLDFKQLSFALEELTPTEVHFSIPKLTVHSLLSFQAPLKRLGLKTLFETRTANLSGNAGTSDLSLKDEKPTVNLVIRERGSMHAPVLNNTSPIGSEEHPVSYLSTAGRAFVYLIRHRPSKAIIFIGNMY